MRTVTKAMNQEDGIVVVDTPPGEGNVVQAALGRADAVVIPTRAGGVEPNRVVTTLEMTPRNVPAGVVICSARLGTKDLEATIEWWTELKVPVWGIVPERVSIASRPVGGALERGPRVYGKVLRKATQGARRPSRAERRRLSQRAGRPGVRAWIAAVDPGHRRLAVQLADDLRDEPAPHRDAGRRRRQRQQLWLTARTRLPRPAWRRRTRTAAAADCGRSSVQSKYSTLLSTAACHTSSMPGPRRLKRVPISDTSTASRSGSSGALSGCCPTAPS